MSDNSQGFARQGMNSELDLLSSKPASKTASGVSSIVIGTLSLMAVCVTRHYESFRGATGVHLIDILDRLGLVREAPPDTEAGLSASGLIFPLTDEGVLSALLLYGVYLGIASVLLAVWAEYRREENVYLSAGFMCGAGGLFLAGPLFSAIAIAMGAFAILLLRHRAP